MCPARRCRCLVAYHRKEGRSLSEVTEFRFYKARFNQKGGDVADNNFHRTESIAGDSKC